MSTSKFKATEEKLKLFSHFYQIFVKCKLGLYTFFYLNAMIASSTNFDKLTFHHHGIFERVSFQNVFIFCELLRTNICA